MKQQDEQAPGTVVKKGKCEHGIAWSMECLSCGPSDFEATSTTTARAIARELDGLTQLRISRPNGQPLSEDDLEPVSRLIASVLVRQNINADLLQQQPAKERECVKCGHGFVDDKGICTVAAVPLDYTEADLRRERPMFPPLQRCGCKCVFPVAATTAAEGERDVWDLLNKRRHELIAGKLERGFLEDRDEADYLALQRVAGIVREIVSGEPFQVNVNTLRNAPTPATAAGAPQDDTTPTATCPNCGWYLSAHKDFTKAFCERCEFSKPIQPAPSTTTPIETAKDIVCEWVTGLAYGSLPPGQISRLTELIALRFPSTEATQAAATGDNALSGSVATRRLSHQGDNSMTKDYDGFRAGMLRAAEMARVEFKRAPEAARGNDCVWMGGYESACDHLSVAIAQAAVIDSVRIAGAQPDWQYHIALLLPDDGVEDRALLKIYQVVEHELRTARADAIRVAGVAVANGLRNTRENFIPVNRAMEIAASALESLAKEGGGDGPQV